MIPEPSLAVLRALQSIHETGSVSQTANALGVTQSAISRSIGNYEKAIGLQMLCRDTRPLRLTKEGFLVVKHATEIDRSIRTLGERLEALRQGKEGVVRIGSFGSSATSRILPDLLTKFAKHYPGISVSIVEGSDDRTRTDLIHGNVDVAVLCDPVEDFEAITIASDELVALLPKGSALSKRQNLSPTDLECRPFVMTLAGSEPAILDWFEASGTAPNIKHRIQQTHSILELVRAQMGVAIVTSLSLPATYHDVIVKPLRPTTERHIHMVKKHGNSNSKAVDVFWNFLSRTIHEESAD
ncbi:LysR family transcriptional regulator [Planktotalea sp.]|uniref:LysR family transcriptional regulator n=1 Tax=Planktotalea sp. TaxID=2029877 RepID=UPI0025F0DF74|nr:LysR family transcriptional regulator [Planktotalea sp.]